MRRFVCWKVFVIVVLSADGTGVGHTFYYLTDAKLR